MDFPRLVIERTREGCARVEGLALLKILLQIVPKERANGIAVCFHCRVRCEYCDVHLSGE
jgi:hypothetical protein